MKTAYTVTLTREEYRSAMVMSYRGYLGELTIHAYTVEEDADGNFVLGFREPDAWEVLATCDEDPYAVWSLTTPNTSLGQKFQALLDQIV